MGWIAWENAFIAVGGVKGGKKAHAAGYAARNEVITRAIKFGLLSGPAESKEGFSARSTMRLFNGDK